MADELVEYARYQFKLNRRMKDGATLRQHLESGYRQTGVMPDELANEPELPELVAHVWQYFAEIHRTRGNNGFGENPLTYTEIGAWCNLTGIRLEQWELQTIIAIDAEYLAAQAEARDKDK